MRLLRNVPYLAFVRRHSRFVLATKVNGELVPTKLNFSLESDMNDIDEFENVVNVKVKTDSGEGWYIGVGNLILSKERTGRVTYTNFRKHEAWYGYIQPEGQKQGYKFYMVR